MLHKIILALAIVLVALFSTYLLVGAAEGQSTVRAIVGTDLVKFVTATGETLRFTLVREKRCEETLPASACWSVLDFKEGTVTPITEAFFPESGVTALKNGAWAVGESLLGTIVFFPETGKWLSWEAYNLLK